MIKFNIVHPPCYYTTYIIFNSNLFHYDIIDWFLLRHVSASVLGQR